jgi:hypothetical protein
VGEQILDVLSKLHRDLILLNFDDVSGHLAGVFVFFESDGSKVHVGAATCLGWTGLAGKFQSAVSGGAFACWPSIRIRIVAAVLLESLSLGAVALVVLGIPFEARTGPGAIGAPSLINHRNVRAMPQSTNQPSIGPDPYAVSAMMRSWSSIESS